MLRVRPMAVHAGALPLVALGKVLVKFLFRFALGAGATIVAKLSMTFVRERAREGSLDRRVVVKRGCQR